MTKSLNYTDFIKIGDKIYDYNKKQKEVCTV